MAEHNPAYLQAKGLDAVDDRMVIEATFGEGSEGVVTSSSFRVTSGGGTTNMSITVSPGRGVVASDVAFGGSYHGVLDSNKPLDLGASSGSQYRRDAIVARIRDASLVAADGDSGFSLETVAGAYSNSATPPLPALPDRSFLVADVLINPGATTPSKITDQRRMVRPRVWEAQVSQQSASTVYADKDDWNQVSAVDFGNSAGLVVPAWVLAGGGRCEHEIGIQANAIAVSEVDFRSVIGNALNDAKASSYWHFYRIYAPGVHEYVARGEYTLPVLQTVLSQLQVRRTVSRITALSFDAGTSIATHRLRVTEQPT